LSQRRPVGHQPEGLAYAHVVERLQVGRHRDRDDLRPVPDEHADLAFALLLLRLRECELLDRVHLAREERVQPRTESPGSS